MINPFSAFYGAFVLSVLIIGAPVFIVGIIWSHGVPVIKKHNKNNIGAIHMKSKYLVYQTKWIDEDGTPILKYVKTFRHEPEALAYINAHENDDVYLDREDSDGKRYEWDANSKSWERIYGEGEIE